MKKIDFEKNSQIGTYCILTNTYCLVGPSINRSFYSAIEEVLKVPIIETTINTIKNVGTLAVGNKFGLVVAETCTDAEFLHIRNSLPENVKLRRVGDRFNAFGNTVICNDYIALVHPEISDETIQILKEVLNVKVIKISIGDRALVGTYSAMNNVGMLVHPFVSSEEIDELNRVTGLRVIAGSVDNGMDSVGKSLLINDYTGFVGRASSNVEVSKMEQVFKLTDHNAEDTWFDHFL